MSSNLVMAALLMLSVQQGIAQVDERKLQQDEVEQDVCLITPRSAVPLSRPQCDPLCDVQYGPNFETDVVRRDTLHVLAPASQSAQAVVYFTTAKFGRVTLTIVDGAGKRITTIYDGVMDAGEHEIQFDAATLPMGLWFYNLVVGQKEEIAALAR